MANNDRMEPVAAPPRTHDEEHAEADKKAKVAGTGAAPPPHHRPARPDPKTGEVPAGPGDAGLQDRPALNAGSPGTRQMSNRRLGIGLGILALLMVVVFAFAAMF